MASPISIYLSDDTLRRLDDAVAKQAREDRRNGLTGRQVANRSNYLERLIRDALESRDELTRERIEYAVVSLAESYGAKKVSLFGSRARGDFDANSDVDILLDKGKIRGLQVIDFQEDLQRALGKKVDVVTTAGASERFLNKIANDLVVLYEAS